jgi:hypothetical protein
LADHNPGRSEPPSTASAPDVAGQSDPTHLSESYEGV